MGAPSQVLQVDILQGEPGPGGAFSRSRSLRGTLRSIPLDDSRSVERADADASPSTTAFVIPTLNESDSLAELVAGIAGVMGVRPYRVLVVDDGSTDGTVELVRALIAGGHPVDLLERGEKLGIGSAVRDGLLWGLTLPSVERIVTIDADLSHDPRDVPRLLRAAETVDLVQGSRYVIGGRILNWGWSRRLLSLIANMLVRVLLRTEMREHTTYFRAYSRRAAEAAVRAEGCGGYDWALGSLSAVRNEGLSLSEVPITFRERKGGKSKMSPEAMVRWAQYLVSAALNSRRVGSPATHLPRFAAVGGLGIFVNLAALYLLLGVAGLWPFAALALAIETSITSNFIGNDLWTFRNRRAGTSRWRRFGVYHAVCALGFAVNLVVFAVLTLGFGANYLLANMLAILAGFGANLRGSVSWAWVAR